MKYIVGANKPLKYRMNIYGILAWQTHIHCVASKLNKSVYLLRNLSNSLSPPNLKTSYFAHVRLTFSTAFYCHIGSLGRLFELQRRAIRFLLNLGYRQDTKE